MTSLACLSVPGRGVALSVLESLSFTREALPGALVDLRDRSGASQLFVLSTCERTEVYAVWPQPPPGDVLAHALAANRGLPPSLVEDAAARYADSDAVLHLLRVTAGLESFVLGERDIVGQVRSAAEASRAAGTLGLELERLLAAAVRTSRRVHRDTDLAGSARSVVAGAVRQAAAEQGGDLGGCRVLVVGSGHVGTEATERAAGLGAAVTVCCRTRRHAERLVASGAAVVDLARLQDVLAECDVAIFATAAPHRLLDADQLAQVPMPTKGERLVIDLCVPRNVDPAVRRLPGVRLVDLADLHASSLHPDEPLTADVAAAERIVLTQLHGYQSWLTGREAAASVRRLRADLEEAAREHVDRATRGLPEDVRAVVETAIHRAVRHIGHAPTRRLLEAAEQGDDRLVAALASLFAAESSTP